MKVPFGLVKQFCIPFGTIHWARPKSVIIKSCNYEINNHNNDMLSITPLIITKTKSLLGLAIYYFLHESMSYNNSLNLRGEKNT